MGVALRNPPILNRLLFITLCFATTAGDAAPSVTPRSDQKQSTEVGQPANPSTDFVGLWRIIQTRPSLMNNMDTFNMSPTTNLGRYRNHIIGIGTVPPSGLTCDDLRPTPPGQSIIKRLSLSDKKDFTYQELIQALKTCEISEFKVVSEKFINSLAEARISCKQTLSIPHQEPLLPPLTHITLLSQKYALGHMPNEYVCLERVPALVPEPVKLAGYREIRGGVKSPLISGSAGQNQAPASTKEPAISPFPNICQNARFIQKHAEESALSRLLNKNSLVALEAVETALKTCNITLGDEPLKKIRRMRHYEILCGDLLLTTTEPSEIHWFAITSQNQILAATTDQFFCYSHRKSRSH